MCWPIRKESSTIAAAKALIRGVANARDVQEVTSLTAKTLAARRATPEGQEGLKAFLEKRTPRWTK